MSDRAPPLLSTEQIYDALLDDEAFDRLPDLLARMVGARSATLAWRYPDGDTDVLRHNHYFTDAHFADYCANYAAADPWIAVAHRPQRMNRAIRMDEEIDAAAVRQTSFYNDWLRAMGDDTLHCLGAATRTGNGEGIIGLHRGESDRGAFTVEESGRLAEVFPHVARMLVLRGKLAEAARQTQTAQSALDATGLAMIIVDPAGIVRSVNAAGQAALFEGEPPARLRGGAISAGADLTCAIAHATHRAVPGATAIMVRRSDDSPVYVNVTPCTDPSGRRAAMILFRYGADHAARRDGLRQLFALTEAEADVALLLSRGEPASRIAILRGTSLQTVRTQVRTVMGKMACSRQAELTALINALPF
ncbi:MULTISPECIES: helix-turn-helix transcriptional regulator [unclassified Novosphingobium]|uniref:helix-turn-helix transcriptional regulator n=1 Tax=unclassified Novosphingobium TaxID=2644732 RepID=UPI00135708EF|nr:MULTISPECIES: helix-turn-helix transcriptional regulator [unclassified Novosphingobium]